MHIPIRTFGALCIALSVGAPASAADLKVGFISSRSGPVAALGIPYEKGIRAAMAAQPLIAWHTVQ